MILRTGTYVVPVHRWYIERTVWLVAGVVLLTGTALALLVDPRWILTVTATGLVSINVAFTGFCPVGNVLRVIGFTPMLGEETAPRRNLYFMQTDRWYLERRIYLGVGSSSSSGAQWCGSRPPVIASWPMRSTGWAPSRGSIPMRCLRLAARTARSRRSVLPADVTWRRESPRTRAAGELRRN